MSANLRVRKTLKLKWLLPQDRYRHVVSVVDPHKVMSLAVPTNLAGYLERRVGAVGFSCAEKTPSTPSQTTKTNVGGQSVKTMHTTRGYNGDSLLKM